MLAHLTATTTATTVIRQHENIIELVDCFTTPDLAVCLVYECATTDLEKILANKAIPMGLADIKRHLLSLLRAVAACHDRWILHRDLKPDNLLFLKDGTMKLADFGLARMYGTPKTRLSPQAITLWYKPPELLLGAYEYSSAADMWSVRGDENVTLFLDVALPTDVALFSQQFVFSNPSFFLQWAWTGGLHLCRIALAEALFAREEQ